MITENLILILAVFALCWILSDSNPSNLKSKTVKYMGKVNNPPAFPTMVEKQKGFNKTEMETTPGMTLRDYFAAAALQGFAANLRWAEKLDMSDDWDDYIKRMTTGAYECADAMLEARSAVLKMEE